MDIHITPEMFEAVNTYLLAKTYTETIRPQIEGIKRAQLLSKEYYDELTGERITDIKDDYQMGEKSFAEYAACCHAAYEVAGYHEPPDHCPLLVAEDLERQACRCMIETCEPILQGMTYQRLILHYGAIGKVTDLLVRMLVNHPNYVAPNLSKITA